MIYPRGQRQARTGLLYSQAQLERLWEARVMIFGLGGVGSYAAEALCRSGIGHIFLVDADEVAVSNMNRQLPALHSTVGKPKVQVMKERLLDIAPDAHIEAIQAFHLPENPVCIPEGTTYVVDAVDTVAAKLDIASTCSAKGIPVISCMGMGNRLDPSQIRVGDLFETSGCPLCRVMRKELRRCGVSSLRCVYSLEPAIAPQESGMIEPRASGRPAPGSMVFVPAVAGLYLAQEVVTQLAMRQGE